MFGNEAVMTKSSKVALELEKHRIELAEELIKDIPDQSKVKSLARKCRITLPKDLTQQLGVTLLAMDERQSDDLDQTEHT